MAMRNSCVLSGPNGYLRFWCFQGDENRANFNAKFFTSFSPINTCEIRELWVGGNTEFHFGTGLNYWEQNTARVRGAFGVLTKVEDLTVVRSELEPFFAALCPTTDGPILLPGLRRLTLYVRRGDLNISALTQCAETRFERSRSLGEVTIVFENEPEADEIREVESLGRFVGKLSHHIGGVPDMRWEIQCDVW